MLSIGDLVLAADPLQHNAEYLYGVFSFVSQVTVGTDCIINFANYDFITVCHSPSHTRGGSRGGGHGALAPAPAGKDPIFLARTLIF